MTGFVADEAPVTFSTSGTTGEPVEWVRTTAQLDAETRLLADLLDGPDLDAVLTHAPQAHLYGHLVGDRLPRLLSLPVHRVPVAKPFHLAGARHPLLVTLPASFSVLARSLRGLDGARRVTIVFSSAEIPQLARTVTAALGDRGRLVELFGSTETGLVASRVFAESPEWTLAPDVRFGAELTATGSGRLAVLGPRLARRAGQPVPVGITLDDLVSVVDDRTFRWHGRVSRMIKVNGRKVDLDAVLGVLATAAPSATLSCRPEADDVRGEWFTVTVAPDDPATRHALDAAITTLPAWQRPRAVLPTVTRT